MVGLLGGSNAWTGNNDFSGASHTLPAKAGTVANRPATCTVGGIVPRHGCRDGRFEPALLHGGKCLDGYAVRGMGC